MSEISVGLTKRRDANTQHDKGNRRDNVKLAKKRKSSDPSILPAFGTREENHRKANDE
jgi:hypothetical protein